MSTGEVALNGSRVWKPRVTLRKTIGHVFLGLCIAAISTGLILLTALIIDVTLDGGARLFASPSTDGLPSTGIAVAAPVAAWALVLLPRAIPGTADQPVLGRLARATMVWPALFTVCWIAYLFLDNSFLGSFASRFPERAGIYAALVGTLYMMAITAAVAFPLGVGAAIYLEEYARRNWFSRFIQINIANLAGVPSIVYGLLGLQLFVRLMELERSVLAGALTMALLVMPIIVVSAQESLKAVPPSVREAAYALGATRWQVVRHAVLPYALGGMLTGNILAMSRAIGETAPLIMIGALTFIAFLPSSPSDPFTVLPIQIFNWVSRPQEGFQTIAAAGIILLLLILLVMNSVAMILRQRTQIRCRRTETNEMTMLANEPTTSTDEHRADGLRRSTAGAGGPRDASLFDEIEQVGPAVQHEIEETAALEIRNLSVFYGRFQALDSVSMDIATNRVTALIGPSGCGKSTLLRCLNRMNDLIETARTEGEIFFEDTNLLGEAVDPVNIRRRIGMVFQKPNPFPKSIYDNVAFGPRINGYRGNMDDLVEDSLRKAALWDEVKDDLKKSGLALSGGQQQRLCIARTIAIQPEIILMDEPASALDPVATLKIEDLMRELAEEYTIVVVTHNMQQAARVSDYTAFLLAGQERTGRLIEFGPTNEIFTNPQDRRTEDYITGRYG